jgi:hypothetical protein
VFSVNGCKIKEFGKPIYQIQCGNGKKIIYEILELENSLKMPVFPGFLTWVRPGMKFQAETHKKLL